MQELYDLVFWQNTPSLHQAPLMRALAAGLGKRVLIVVAEDVPAGRLAMGWQDIDYGDADLIIEPSAAMRRLLVDATRAAAAHIFSGVSSYPAVSETLALLKQGPHNHIAIITEPWDPRGVKGVLRSLQFRMRSRALLKTDTLFACGPLARRQFSSLGYDSRRIASFGYFVDGPAQTVLGPARTQVDSAWGRSRAVFVGTFTEWKDPVTLLKALALTPSDSWEMTMVGDGPLRARCIQIAKDMGLSHRVSFLRSLPNSAALEVISVSDVLILPSKYDGWGAVVSEALMAGTPVIVSSECGASDLVRSSLQGEVVHSGRPMEIARALGRRSLARPLATQSRVELRAWARDAASPQAAAQYMWDTVTRGPGVRTSPPPWEPAA